MRPAEQLDVFDQWSIVHAIVGGIAGGLGWSLPAYLTAFALFELAEQFKLTPFRLGWRREAIQNVLGDLLASSAGYVIVRGVRGK